MTTQIRVDRRRRHALGSEKITSAAWTKSINIIFEALFGPKFVFSLLKFLNGISSKAKFLPQKCLLTARF
jgi:hypothetical protein